MGAYSSGPVNSDTFRNQINNGFYNIDKSSINCTGIFNEYYFKNTNKSQNQITKLFETSYAFAQTQDLFTNKEDIYMSIGLHSSEDGKNFRNKLNLIVVLDISGSMGSRFYSKGNNVKSENQYQTKIQVAKEVLYEIFTILTEQDCFGIVLFDDHAEVLQQIKPTKSINQDEIKQRISAITERGGTNMEIGYKEAINMLEGFEKKTNSDVQFSKNDSRILFLTDACPNQGGGQDDLTSLSKKIAIEKNIYTTFIGVGLDFNTALVNDLTKVRGSNYFSVHSAEQFKKILVTDFNYIMTPIIFDVKLILQSSDAVQITKTYGGQEDQSNNKNEQNSMQKVLQEMRTVMASDINSKGIKGGIILVKLNVDFQKLQQNQNIKLILNYLDKKNQQFSDNEEINLFQKLQTLKQNNQNFEMSGIQKAFALSQYYELMLEISDNKISKEKIQICIDYFEKVKQLTDDEVLIQEIDILKKIKNQQ